MDSESVMGEHPANIVIPTLSQKLFARPKHLLFVLKGSVSEEYLVKRIDADNKDIFPFHARHKDLRIVRFLSFIGLGQWRHKAGHPILPGGR